MKKEVGSKGTSSGALKYFKSATKDELQKEKAFVHMKKMEDKLRYYKQMVIDSNNAIIIQDFKGTIKAWSPGATKLYHFTEKEMLGKNITKLISPKDRARARRNISDIRKGKPTFSIGQTRISKDKQEVFVNITYSPIFEKEEIIEIATTEEDTSKLKKSLEKYIQLFDNMNEGVVIYSVKNGGKDIIIMDMNKAAEKLEKVVKNDIIGKKVEAVFNGVKDFGLYSLFKKVWKTGKPEILLNSFYKDKHRQGWRENFVYKLPSGEIVAIYSDVTEKKNVENNLKKSYDLIFAITSQSQDSIFSKDKDGHYLFVNPAAEKMIGLKKKDILGKTAAQIYSNSNAAIIKEVDDLCLKGKSADKVVLTTIGGEKKFLHTVQSPVYSEGKVSGIIGVVRDVTERNKIQEELKLFNFLVEKSAEEIAIADLRGNIVYANFSWAENHGYSAKWLVGKNLSMFHPKEELKNVTQFNKKLIRCGKHQGEVVHKRKDGSTYLAAMNCFVIRNKNKISYLVGISRDITKKKETEDKLQKSEERYRIITKQTGHLVYDYNCKSGDIRWYGAIKECTGCSYEEFQKINIKRWGQLIHPDDRKEVFRLLNEAKQKVGKYYCEYRFKKKDGSYEYFSDAGVFLAGKNGKAERMLGTMKDISKRKKLELELTKAKEELEQKVEERTAELKQSELRFSSLFDLSRDAIMTLAPPSWKFTSCNKATLKLFDVKDEKQFISLGPWQLSPEKQPDGQISVVKAKKMIMKAMKAGSNFFEWTHKRYKGEDFPATVLLSKVGINGDSFLQATVRDITKEKTFQEQLKKSKNQLSTIIKTIPEGMDIVDEDCNILWLGDKFLKIFGKKAIGKKCYELYNDDKKQCHNCPLKNKIKVGETKSLIVENIMGGQTFEILHTGMIFEGKNAIMETFNNITTKKEAELEIKRANDQLAQKIVDLEKFNKLTIGREMKMIELKKKVKSLELKVEQSKDPIKN